MLAAAAFSAVAASLRVPLLVLAFAFVATGLLFVVREPVCALVAVLLAVAVAAVVTEQLNDQLRELAPVSSCGAVSANVTALEGPEHGLGASYKFNAEVKLATRTTTVRVQYVAPTSPPNFTTGQILQTRGKLCPPSKLEQDRGLVRVAGVLRGSSVQPTAARRGGIGGAIDAVRSRAEQGLASGMQPAQSALLRGMVLGQDGGLTERQRDQFRRSSLAHVLAASGQNVMLLAALALPLLALVGVRRRWRFVVLGLLITCYVPLAGGGPSIQRAGVMGVLGAFALLSSRPARRWYALLLAVLITVLLDPQAPIDVGWQLSFAAVLGIFVLAEPLKRWLHQKRLPNQLAEAVALTGAATVATAPIGVAQFETLSLISLPANLLAAVVIGPITWLGMISAVIAQFSAELAALPNAINQFLLAYLEGVASTAAEPSWASVQLELPQLLEIVLGLGVGIGLLVGVQLLWRKRPAPVRTGSRTPTYVLLAALAALAVALAAPGRNAAPDSPTMTVLDVGQGAATLLQSRSATALVDTGENSGRTVELLEARGIEHLDLVVLSHDAADHIGAAAAVLDKFPTRVLIDGAGARGSVAHQALLAIGKHHGVERVVAVAGQQVAIGDWKLELLWPPPGAEHDKNDGAVVVRADYGAFSALLTADAESNITASLSQAADIGVLQVAHHGSADTGLSDLLSKTNPRYAVIPVGKNSYGHPHPSTLQALAASGTDLARTDRDGSVQIKARADGNFEARTDR